MKPFVQLSAVMAMGQGLAILALPCLGLMELSNQVLLKLVGARLIVLIHSPDASTRWTGSSGQLILRLGGINRLLLVLNIAAGASRPLLLETGVASRARPARWEVSPTFKWAVAPSASLVTSIASHMSKEVVVIAVTAATFSASQTTSVAVTAAAATVTVVVAAVAAAEVAPARTPLSHFPLPA